MKKIIVLLSTLLICLSLCACTKKDNNEIKALFDEGYIVRSTTNDGEKVYKCILNKDDKFIFMLGKVNAKKLEELENIDFLSDTYEQDTIDFICSITDYELRDISDVIPSQEELDKYVGLSFEELENMGFMNSGYIETDNKQFNFFFENDTYSFTVGMQEGVTIENMDDYSENDIRQLKVGCVKYPDISPYILETLN